MSLGSTCIVTYIKEIFINNLDYNISTYQDYYQLSRININKKMLNSVNGDGKPITILILNIVYVDAVSLKPIKGVSYYI